MSLSQKLNPIPDCNDDNLFRDIIHEYCETSYFDLKSFCAEYSLSRPTVSRWAKGITAPHPLLRKHVYNFIAKAAKNNGD